MARVPRITGAFHGAMPSTTPAGWRSASARLPSTSEGITSPPTWVTRPAASRSMLAANIALKPYQVGVDAASATPMATNSGARRSITSAAFNSSLRRALGASAAQAGKAAAAAATAASASSNVAAAATVTTSPLSGFLRSKVAPLAAGRLTPPISNSILFMVSSSIQSRRPRAAGVFATSGLLTCAGRFAGPASGSCRRGIASCLPCGPAPDRGRCTGRAWRTGSPRTDPNPVRGNA